MSEPPLKSDRAVFPPCVVGDQVIFRKTISESDVYLFAGISGDFNRNHVDEEAMSKSEYGRRIVHGALLLAFVSSASTRFIEQSGMPAVAYGYDRVRFIKPVYFGDTVEVAYQVVEAHPGEPKVVTAARITNQHAELVAIATNLIFYTADESSETDE
jgi:3-hydroxybutyryl-CoA dehydratase